MKLDLLNKQKKKKVVYVDSSYDWRKTIKGKGIGKIAIVQGNKKVVMKRELCFPKLKQLNNRFELLAIKEGLKIGGDNCIVYSDSQVAVRWIKDNRVKWISREKNKAGWILDSLDNTFAKSIIKIDC